MGVFKGTRKKKEDAALPTFKSELDLIDEILEFMASGYSRSEMIHHFVAVKGWTERNTIKLMARASNQLDNMLNIDYPTIIDRHVQLYEEAYQYFENNSVWFGKRKALGQKEKLLAMHKEENVVEINNQINVVMDAEPVYNFDKLEIEKRNRLELLLEKAKPLTKTNDKP